LYLLLRICSCTLTKDIRHLIKLSFNTPKPTRGLDALSGVNHSEATCQALGLHVTV
jgi:hypothetical protein